MTFLRRLVPTLGSDPGVVGMQRLYLIKLQRDEEGQVRVELRDLATGARRYFCDLAQLARYLERALTPTPLDAPEG